MRKIDQIPSILIVLMVLLLEACGKIHEVNDHEEPEIDAPIVLMFEDSLVRGFFRERKASLKYLDDASIPVSIDFSRNENHLIVSIDTKRQAIDLKYTDNSQSQFSYLLASGDSVLIRLVEGRPRLKTLNNRRSVYDDNLELLRNRELFRSTYTPLQDFYFLWQANFASSTPVDLRVERMESRERATDSGIKELSWLDSLKDMNLIAEKTASFYMKKTRVEVEQLKFFDTADGIFDPLGALDHYMASLTEGSELLQTVYFDEFSDFLLAQIKPINYADILLQDTLGTYFKPFGKRMLFKLLQKSLPNVSFDSADKWLNTYRYSLENESQFDFLNARIHNLKGERPDMDLMGLGNHLVSFEELLDMKKGSYLYVDLWAAWCIPCIKAFPVLRDLHEQYHAQGIEVIHLSVDKNVKFWEEVVRKHDIAFPDRSYVVLNLGESVFLDKLDVSFIPRYLLFDPTGNLIHPNAPGPEEDEIGKIFIEELKR